jgi:thiamine-phosphate pyrophosphorylase
MFTYPNKIVCVTNRALCPRPFEEQIPRVAAAGVKRLILREKDLTEREYTVLAERVYESCLRCGIDLIIHNYPQAARDLKIGKIHMPLSLLTADICAEFDSVGSSVHSADEARKAESLGASCVTAGHIFATDCKRGLPPRGLDFLAEVCRAVEIPVYAIGGITEENLPDVLSAGAQGACIMSGLMKI